MSSRMVVGHGGSVLAPDIAAKLHASYYEVTVDQFADQEIFIRSSLPDVIDMPILVVYQFSYNFVEELHSVNDQLIGLLQLITTLKQRTTQTISLLLPYMPYSRQDHDFEKRYPGFLFTLGACLKTLGVDRVFTCDIHVPYVSTQFALPLHNIECAQIWYDAFVSQVEQFDCASMCVAAADHGGYQRAAVLAALYKVPVVSVEKKRERPDNAIASNIIGTVQDKDILLVDDIFDTGHTALSACKLLKEAGARKIYGFFTHALFSDIEGRDGVKNGFEKIFVTDTILNKWVLSNHLVSTVSINDYIVAVLQKLL